MQEGDEQVSYIGDGVSHVLLLLPEDVLFSPLTSTTDLGLGSLRLYDCFSLSQLPIVC